jgi:rubrerythrin
MSMPTRSKRNARLRSAYEQDTRIIACPACGLVDIDPEQEELCPDCREEVQQIEHWWREESGE